MFIKTFHPTELSTGEPVELMRRPANETLTATFLLPMERKGAETRKNPLVFKNALAEAKRRLDREYPKDCLLRDSLDTLRPLEDPLCEFWQFQDAGLILAIREDGTAEAYLLPFSTGPFVHIGRRPYLIPLLRLLDRNRFHVLVLDLNRLQLMRADQWESERVELDGVPTSLSQAMRFDDPEKSLQQRRVTATNLPGPGGGNIAVHGHGVTGRETRNKKVRRFFEQVDDGLAGNFEDREIPLVLCGPESEVGLYREVNHFPHLFEEALVFNPANLSPGEIDVRIRHWISRRDAESRREILGELESELGQGHASVDLREIDRAAAEGRIAQLYLRDGCHRYGRRHEDSGSVILHEKREPGDDELLAEVVEAAAGTGSELLCFPPEEHLPQDAATAAVFRF